MSNGNMNERFYSFQFIHLLYAALTIYYIIFNSSIRFFKIIIKYEKKLNIKIIRRNNK